MPIETLRVFLSELVNETSLREAGRLIGRGREQVRKFVSGQIQTPHDRTREAIARMYLERQAAAGRVAERPAATRTPTPLKMILPPGIERATAEIRAIFEIVRSHPDVPDSATALETWLLRRVKDEYAAEKPIPRIRRPRRPKPPPAE